MGNSSREAAASYREGPLLDAAFLSLFRNKLAQEVGRDADRPGYDGLIQLSQLLMAKYKAKSDVEQATVRILNSMFPQSLLRLFRAVVLPINKGKLAAILSARVTQATCQWLMGTCSIGSVELSDGTSIPSGVLVEKCKYLEHSKCAGICIHTCKLPTQAFISKELGVPLLMEPNFADLSCQFKFGVEAPSPEDDPSVSTPCLEMCPTAIARKSSTPLCPKVNEWMVCGDTHQRDVSFCRSREKLLLTSAAIGYG
ncbi:hypothetical protein SELMODRAFT_99098 [Selaginella moellendorffii]|uniref:Beta-carotene isomerase D27-like C-terminal domain-containing protein n=1 Tax=Selaginella moellendorffii TaxID=88036 RepID=D8RQG5_SELML|nr:hypothetical protein SELMODRAFT_99098 [Selaginella moellendorffii]